ncbi:MAG: hypothetical protein GY730_03790 [bacterium]|nr:hypothetical protein [bacterium]
MKKKIYAGLLALIAAFILSPTVNYAMDFTKKPVICSDIIDELDLSSTKAQDIKDLLLNYKTNKNERKAKLENNFMRLHAELDKEKPDIGNIKKYKSNIVSIKKAMLDSKVQKKLNLKEKLTAEQLKKLKSIMKGRSQHSDCTKPRYNKKRLKKNKR